MNYNLLCQKYKSKYQQAKLRQRGGQFEGPPIWPGLSQPRVERPIPELARPHRPVGPPIHISESTSEPMPPNLESLRAEARNMPRTTRSQAPVYGRESLLRTQRPQTGGQPEFEDLTRTNRPPISAAHYRQTQRAHEEQARQWQQVRAQAERPHKPRPPEPPVYGRESLTEAQRAFRTQNGGQPFEDLTTTYQPRLSEAHIQQTQRAIDEEARQWQRVRAQAQRPHNPRQPEPPVYGRESLTTARNPRLEEIRQQNNLEKLRSEPYKIPQTGRHQELSSTSESLDHIEKHNLRQARRGSPSISTYDPSHVRPETISWEPEPEPEFHRVSGHELAARPQEYIPSRPLTQAQRAHQFDMPTESITSPDQT